jgi:hypothetical protein
VHLADLILLGSVAVVLVLGWILRRLGSIWGVRLPLFAGIPVRVAASLILAWEAVHAAERGGVWFTALAIAVGLVALGTLAFTVLLTRGLLRYDSDAKN